MYDSNFFLFIFATNFFSANFEEKYLWEKFIATPTPGVLLLRSLDPNHTAYVFVYISVASELKVTLLTNENKQHCMVGGIRGTPPTSCAGFCVVTLPSPHALIVLTFTLGVNDMVLLRIGHAVVGTSVINLYRDESS
jgi:hypothetical protein